jgi:hypothetical protein
MGEIIRDYCIIYLFVYEYSEVLFICDFIPYWSCFVTPVEDSVVITRISMLTMSVIYNNKGRRDRMVAGYTTTYAISAYHNWCWVLDSNPGRGVQLYVIKFVSDSR